MIRNQAVRRWALLALLAAWGLGGCAARPAPPPRKPPAVPGRPAQRPIPPRPTIGPGDVLAGFLPGEAAPRVCFAPGKWREILSYVLALRVHATGETARLRAHIERLEGQIRRMQGRRG